VNKLQKLKKLKQKLDYETTLLQANNCFRVQEGILKRIQSIRSQIRELERT